MSELKKILDCQGDFLEFSDGAIFVVLKNRWGETVLVGKTFGITLLDEFVDSDGVIKVFKNTSSRDITVSKVYRLKSDGKENMRVTMSAESFEFYLKLQKDGFLSEFFETVYERVNG